MKNALRLMILRRSLQMASFVSRDTADIPISMFRDAIKLQAVHANGVCNELADSLIILSAIETSTDFYNSDVQQELRQLIHPSTLADLTLSIDVCQAAGGYNLPLGEQMQMLSVALADITREDLQGSELRARMTGDVPPSGESDAPPIPVETEIVFHVDLEHARKYDALTEWNVLQEECARLLVGF